MQLQKHFINFLSNKPELLRKYVNTSVSALSYVLVPINVFMKHLLEVQGLDPNTVPGQKELKVLQEAFDKYHSDEYDSDYDVSWVQKKFAKIREDSRWGGLTQETFIDCTDLSGSPKKNEFSGMLTVESLKSTLKDLVKIADQAVGEGSKFNPGDALARLAKAQEVVKDLKIAEPIQQLVDAIKNTEESKPKKSDKKTGIKTSKKKLNKKAGSFKEPATRLIEKNKFNDSKFKGSFRRVIE